MLCNRDKSFADRESGALFYGRKRKASKPLPEQLAEKARAKLNLVDAATELEELRRPPGNRLEKLSGDREGQHSIRINQQYRVCFRFEGGDAYDVEVTDYH